ncbi:MAG: hypothetical protein ACLT2Z_06395 [Eubacterium sp.]
MAQVFQLRMKKKHCQIEKIKKEYWDARHNCYAFVVGKNNEIRDSAMTVSLRVQPGNRYLKCLLMAIIITPLLW